MIKATLRMPDGREIPVLIRDRTYKKLTATIESLSFKDKLKLLFWRKKK